MRHRHPTRPEPLCDKIVMRFNSRKSPPCRDMNIPTKGIKTFVYIVIDGVLGDALQEGLILWDYDPKGIRLFKPIDVQKVSEELSATGPKATVVAGVFTKEEETMARDLLVSVRLLRGDCAKVPFVFLALDAHVPQIFMTAGCYLRMVPRDSALLEHIHKLKGPSDKECDEFITEFAKPALWDHIVKEGRKLFHDVGKKSIMINYSQDFNALSEEAGRFCRWFQDSLDCMERGAALIGLSLAKKWPKIVVLKETVTRIEGCLSEQSKGVFRETKSAICSELEKIIKNCRILLDQLQNERGL